MELLERPHYQRAVATAGPDARAVEIADTMQFRAVGSVVIVDADDRPIGIVTDRDLTCRVIAKGLDPEATPARDFMSQPLVTVDAKEPLERVAQRMREAGVRRMPVVRDGKLIGLVALDDLLFRVGRELENLIRAVAIEMEASRKRGKREQRRGEWDETISDARSKVEHASREAFDFLAREFEALRERVGGGKREP
jgi:CBS domain-containing protein